ncbi:conserved membrane hypothetical protein [Pseudomonas chlororaphis]|uniref:hypothetical protein n=1 Tax=Pseudomonas chlororaphis TaxID=587753 RepID=UPI0039DF50E9
MSLLILNQLPAIHATLVGLGGSLFGVYALFSTEKRQETKARCKSIIEKLAKLTSDLDQIPTNKIYTLKNGDPDWDLIFGTRKKLLRGLDQSGNADACREFVAMLYDLMCRYRFSDNSFTKARANGDGVFRLLSCRREHCQQFMSVLGSMRHFVSQHNERLIQAAIESDKYVAEMEKKECDELRGRVEAGLPSLPRKDSTEITVAYCLESMQKAFRLMDCYYELVKELQVGLLELDKWNKDFPIRSYSVWATLSAAFVVAFGILLPLVLLSLAGQDLDLCQRYKMCWSAWMEYAVLVFTFIPYFVFASFIMFRLLGRKNDF